MHARAERIVRVPSRYRIESEQLGRELRDIREGLHHAGLRLISVEASVELPDETVNLAAEPLLRSLFVPARGFDNAHNRFL